MSTFHVATRDSNTSMEVLTSSAVYFAIVFGAGFVFGMVRVTWLVPTVGVRVAELTELPLMLTVVFFAARWIHRRFLAERDPRSRLIVGVTALALLLLAELILGVLLLDLTSEGCLLKSRPRFGDRVLPQSLRVCVDALVSR